MIFYEKPIIQKFHIGGVKYISVADAYNAMKNDKIFFLDVREHDEIAVEFFDFKNVFFFPMSEIMEKLDHLPMDISIVAICENGVRSAKVANLLNRQGYKSVSCLDGGIIEWKRNNLPIIETGFKKENSSCNSSSCDCSCSECI